MAPMNVNASFLLATPRKVRAACDSPGIPTGSTPVTRKAAAIRVKTTIRMTLRDIITVTKAVRADLRACG